MSYIWELNISDLDGSEFFFPIKSDKEHYEKNVLQFISKGIPMTTSWDIPLILKKEEKYAYNFFHIRTSIDFLDLEAFEEDEEIKYTPEDAICITQRIYDLLNPLLKNDVEFLPMQSDDGIYYIMNVINWVDCLDKENFKWTISANGFDYQTGGIGCYGENRLPDKRSKLKKEFNVKEDDAESIARAIYANKDKWKDIALCSRKHGWYKNQSAEWSSFKEREAGYLQKKHLKINLKNNRK